MKTILTVLTFILSAVAFAHEGHKPVEMPKDFATLKNLVGTWEGTTNMDGKTVSVKVVYELTAGGTAIEEKLMPGSDHQMTTIYFKEGKSLAMTHYCTDGNQPHMELKKVEGKSLAFEMKGRSGIASLNEPHMHALTLTMPDANTLIQEWTDYQDGKKKETVVFEFKRKI